MSDDSANIEFVSWICPVSAEPVHFRLEQEDEPIDGEQTVACPACPEDHWTPASGFIEKKGLEGYRVTLHHGLAPHADTRQGNHD